MKRLAASDAARIRAIGEELAIVRLDGPPVMSRVLPEVRQVLEADSMLCVCPVERSTGLELERFDQDNFDHASQFKQRWVSFLASSPRRYAWYDPIRPEPEQRNRVVDALELIPPGEFEASAVYAQVLAPMRLQHHRQLRVLICDGASLLGWFGTFHSQPVTARQRRLLAALRPAVRRRLSLERRLSVAPRTSLALEAALERLGAPTFVIDRTGRVYELNRAGSTLLASRGAELRRALADSVAGRPSTLAFELTPLAERGVPTHYLAILRSTSSDARTADALAIVATRWKLTPRQQQVLALIVRGEGTTTIAAELGIGERAVELHITALFDQAGVDGRAALVSHVLRTA